MIRFTPGRATVVAVLTLSVALGGCGMMKRKPKVDLAVEERPVELLYSTGARRLDARKWNEAIKYFDEVAASVPINICSKYEQPGVTNTCVYNPNGGDYVFNFKIVRTADETAPSLHPEATTH